MSKSAGGGPRKGIWMNAKELGSVASRGLDAAAESAIVRFGARFAMLAATLVILPIGGWLMNREISSIDEMQNSLRMLSQAQALTGQSFASMQGQYAELKEQINTQAGEIYLRSEAQKEWDWQKVRDSAQDADRRRMESELNKRVDSADARLNSLEEKRR